MAQNIANRGFSDKSHYNDLSAPETNVRGGLSRVLMAAMVCGEENARWCQENHHTEKDSALNPHRSMKKSPKT